MTTIAAFPSTIIEAAFGCLHNNNGLLRNYMTAMVCLQKAQSPTTQSPKPQIGPRFAPFSILVYEPFAARVSCLLFFRSNRILPAGNISRVIFPAGNIHQDFSWGIFLRIFLGKIPWHISWEYSQVIVIGNILLTFPRSIPPAIFPGEYALGTILREYSWGVFLGISPGNNSREYR